MAAAGTAVADVHGCALRAFCKWIKVSLLLYPMDPTCRRLEDDIHSFMLPPARDRNTNPVGGGANTTWPGPLLPELARLQRLTQLVLSRMAVAHWQSIPPEWVAPGAFPNLTE